LLSRREHDSAFIKEFSFLELETEMMDAAEKMEFERAASLRDKIKKFSADRFVK
jgi:excinuclease UvrABC helicase subunit UvrB